MAEATTDSVADDKKDDGKVRLSRKEQEDILSVARKRYDRAAKFWDENFRWALDDLKFNVGEHWSQDDANERAANDRPMITVHRTPVLVNQITNELRQNRPAINISPDSDIADAKAADIFKGWMRAIEHESDAETAFDTASDRQVTAGFGYWRLIPQFDHYKSFDQTIAFARVKNIFTVLIDDTAQQPDSSDKKFAFVSAMVDRDEFTREYPNADPISWEQYRTVPDFVKYWCDDKQIRVAEYWLIKNKTRKLVKLTTGHVGYEDELHPSIKALVDANPSMVVDSRNTEVPRVMMYKITACDVLEVHEWPGAHIPIVRVVGNESDIQGKTIYSGVIRAVKDPCRMYDYCCTAEVEKVMLEPKAPYLMAVGQDEGLSREWDDANTKNLTRLHYNPIDANGEVLPPPQRQPFQGVPAGIIAAKASAQEDIHACSGIHIPNIRTQRMPDESGIALQELRQSTDLGTYHYLDNYAKALMFTGEMLLDLAPHYMTSERMLTILHEDGKNEVVRVDPSSPVAYREVVEGNKKVKVFNPRLGKYKVSVTIGPNYATKRKEAASGQLELMKILGPQAAQLIGHIFARNQDWDGADEVSRILAATLPPHLLESGMGDMPPQAQALVAGLKQQIQQMMQQNQQLQQAVQEKQTGFALVADKTEKDHEAKMAKIAADLVKAEAERWQHQFDQIMQTVQQLANANREPALSTVQ